MPSSIEFNEPFKQALHSMEHTSKHLFITGKAGTGKSTLLNHFAKQSAKQPVLLAPTGVAALNIKGQTIHRFFNFYIDITPEKILSKEFKPRSKKIYKKLKTIIIDEISMVRADLLDCIHAFLKLYGPNPKLDFGGVQLILVGDLYQLPPVVSKKEKELFIHFYKSPYFFSAQCYSLLNLTMIELTKVYRQQENTFIELLNAIRNDYATSEQLQQLNNHYQPTFNPDKKEFYIYLTTTNRQSNQINDMKLASLSEEIHIEQAQICGEVTPEYYPTAQTLNYKIGAHIMFLNNDPKQRWVNGSLGLIKQIKNQGSEKSIIIQLADNEQTVAVKRYTWEIFKFKLEKNKIISQPVGTFSQFPFRLAWAITIHKSQGKTFNQVILDLSQGTFACGQLYVALSRCTTLSGIVLTTPIKKQHIITNKKIIDYLTQQQCQQAELTLPLNVKQTMIKQAVSKQKLLKITYLQTNGCQSIRILNPKHVDYFVYQQEKYLGLKAYCKELKQTRIFKLTQILTLTVLEEKIETV